MNNRLSLLALLFSVVISLGHAACPLADTLTHVQDNAGVIDAASKQRMQSKLLSLRDSGVADIAVVTMQTLNGLVAKDAATTMLNDCKLGTAEKDNGLLILLVMDSREWAIETGYGLEGVIPDILTHRIATQRMVPRFKQGQFGAGLADGLYAIDSLLLGERPDDLQTVSAEQHAATPQFSNTNTSAPHSSKSSNSISIFQVLLALILLCIPFYLISMLNLNAPVKKLQEFHDLSDFNRTIQAIPQALSVAKSINPGCFLTFMVMFLLVGIFAVLQFNPANVMLAMPFAGLIQHLINRRFKRQALEQVNQIINSPRADGKAIRLQELPPQTNPHDRILQKKGAIELMAWDNDGKIEFLHLPGAKHGSFKTCDSCKKRSMEHNTQKSNSSHNVYSCVLCSKELREKIVYSSSSGSSHSRSSGGGSSGRSSGGSSHSSRGGSSGGGGSSGKW